MNLPHILLDAYNVLFEGTKTRKVAKEYYYSNSFNNLLKKYAGDDYFVRYVRPWEDKKNNRRVSEVGVKPTYRDHNGNVIVKSMWNNPRGIYCYWLDDVKDRKNASFATDGSTVFIIKRKHVGNQIVDISQLSKSEFDKYSNKLKEYLISSDEYLEIMHEGEYDAFMNKTRSLSNNKSDGGTLFYAIVRLGEISKLNDVRQTYIWRNVLGVTFIGDKGAGIIHPSESSQALFLDKKAYEVIHKADNQRMSFDIYKAASGIKNLTQFIHHINIANMQKSEIIKVAIGTKNPEIIKYAMDHYKKYVDRSSLIDAIHTENDYMIKLIESELISKGENPYSADVFSSAVELGNVYIIKKCIDNGQKIHEVTMGQAMRNVIFFPRGESVEAAKLMFKHYAEQEKDAGNYDAFIELAVKSEDTDLIKMVFEQYVKYQDKYDKNKNPIDVSLNRRSEKCVMLALSLGAKPTHHTLGLALSMNNQAVISAVISAGAEPSDGSLTFAVQNGDLDIVKMVIESGAKPNKYTLDEALRIGDRQIVDEILKLDPEPGDNTIAYLSQLGGMNDLIKQMLDKGAHVDDKSVTNAIHAKNMELLVMLKDYIKDSRHAIYVALDVRDQRMINYVLENGAKPDDYQDVFKALKLGDVETFKRVLDLYSAAADKIPTDRRSNIFSSFLRHAIDTEKLEYIMTVLNDPNTIPNIDDVAYADSKNVAGDVIKLMIKYGEQRGSESIIEFLNK